MRVISGTARGTKLNSIESLSTRPTLDRVKESVFNIIQNKIQDSIILDLFSGSGAIAIEFLSRGAEKAYLCEKNPTAVKMIYNNLEKTKMQDKSVVMLKDYKKALELLKQQNLQFDFVYIDPPYQANISVDSVERILSLNLLKEKGNIIIETDDEKRELLELEKINIEVTDIRKYGRVSLIFLAKVQQNSTRKGLKTMEIFTLLETLEDMLEKSRNVPFSGKCVVDKEEILDIIKEIRLKLPEELKQAKWVKEERQRILVEAQNEADEIIKEAENRIISMIDEHEITRKAYEKKVEIIETANEMSREISKGTKEYADSVLAGIEVALQDAMKVIQNNRKELK